MPAVREKKVIQESIVHPRKKLSAVARKVITSKNKIINIIQIDIHVPITLGRDSISRSHRHILIKFSRMSMPELLPYISPICLMHSVLYSYLGPITPFF